MPQGIPRRIWKDITEKEELIPRHPSYKLDGVGRREMYWLNRVVGWSLMVQKRPNCTGKGKYTVV